jgi:glycosyltransferase involved in cell wall biosynthesis
MPRVSVIIPTYNRAHLIGEAIDSVLAQTYRDFEVILVDDGSTDNTRDVLRKYDGQITYLYQDTQGRSKARNTGIGMATGEYIAFLDSDDVWLPHKLERQVPLLDADLAIGLIHSFTEVIDEHGRLLPEATSSRLVAYDKALKKGYTYEAMSGHCLMFLSTVFIRRECLEAVGPFDPDIPAFEDWDLYLRVALKYRIATIPEPLVRFRIHKGHTSLEEFVEGRIRTAHKHLALLSSRPLPGINKRRTCRNLYLNLASAHYIGGQFDQCRHSTLQAARIDPLVLARPDVARHLLLSLLPGSLVRWLRRVKRYVADETRYGLS